MRDGTILLGGVSDSAEFALARCYGRSRLYYTQDANFNVTGLVDASGAVVERYAYTPYGERTVLDASFVERGTSSFGNLVGHQGLVIDVETGLVYNRARYLHTSMGVFTVRDPLGYVDGMGLYVYEQSQPPGGMDSTGLYYGGSGIRIGSGGRLEPPDWSRPPKRQPEGGIQPVPQPPGLRNPRPKNPVDVDYADSISGDYNCLEWAFNCKNPPYWGSGRPQPRAYTDPAYPPPNDYRDIISDPKRFASWLNGFFALGSSCAQGYSADCEDRCPCPLGWHKIAAFTRSILWHTYDFHFITQDDDGTWSDKEGATGWTTSAAVATEYGLLVGCWCINTPPRTNQWILQSMRPQRWFPNMEAWPYAT